MHVLDNVIWQALTSKQAHLSHKKDEAVRFFNEVSMLAAVSEPSESAFQNLRSLLNIGERVGLFLDAIPPAMREFRLVTSADLLQMVRDTADAIPVGTESQEVVPLGDDDVPEMLALTQLTKPGPFGRRTREMGDYFGIRLNGSLVAMAGERLRVPGHTELSAVCTHPDHLGHGHAKALVTMLLGRIQGRGEVAFLHVLPGNRRAVELYERLGFRTRHPRHYVILEKL